MTYVSMEDDYIYIPQNYPDLLREIPLTSGIILTEIADYKLEFDQLRNEEIERSISLPLFINAFYFFLRKYRYVPRQDEFVRCYLWLNKNNEDIIKIQKNNLLLAGLIARLKRTYPSLVRDVEFNFLVKEWFPNYNVSFNLDLDSMHDIDLLISNGNKYCGLCLFVKTEMAEKFRENKEHRHIRFSNVDYFEIEIDKKECINIGKFWIYGLKEILSIFQHLRDIGF